jgi:hypothetical protein
MDTLEEIAKREREEARLEGEREGIEKGKLEERKRFIEFIMKSLKKTLDNHLTEELKNNQLTEELKDEIRKVDEETINYIEDNLLKMTIEDVEKIKISNVFEILEKITIMDSGIAKLDGLREGFKQGIIEGEREGIEKGKIEERKEMAINLLNKRFDGQLTTEMKEKIKEAEEGRINQIIDNLLEITIEELKELLK